MRKRVTVKELASYCKSKNPREIIYNTENQSGWDCLDTIRVEMNFRDMKVFENPNLVLLRSDSGEVLIDQVDFAELDSGSCVLGDIITVFCGSNINGHRGVPRSAYTLVAR